MSYSDAVYSKAYNLLDNRRNRAENEAQARKNKIYADIPRVKEIENELSSFSVKAAKAVFAGGEVKTQLEILANKSAELKAELDEPFCRMLSKLADENEQLQALILRMRLVR